MFGDALDIASYEKDYHNYYTPTYDVCRNIHRILLTSPTIPFFR
jgi:hypothetical protein